MFKWSIQLNCFSFFKDSTGSLALIHNNQSKSCVHSIRSKRYSISVYSIFIWQSGNTLKYIENCEGFVEKRMCYFLMLQIFWTLKTLEIWLSLPFFSTGTHLAAAYVDLISKIELFNKCLSSKMCMTTTLLLLTVVPTVVRYYIFDMGEDSFYLFGSCFIQLS